jgi:hypothetical protein
MKQKRKKVSPWQRWVIIVTLTAPSKNIACKRLCLTQYQHNTLLREAFQVLNVNTINHAALKLGLIKVNYEELGEWADNNKVDLGAGVTIDLGDE